MTRKIALVAGSTGGIGAATIEALETSASYDEVIGLNRNSAPPLDLLDEKTIAACAHWAGSLEGDIRLVFVATGSLTPDGMRPEKSLREIDPDLLARSYAINAIGPALLLKHFLPLLPRQGRSVFAVLSARVGSIGDNKLGGWYAYRASKAALNQIVRTASVELARKAPEAICVALHPGTVRTQLTDGFSKSGLDVQEPEIAAGRLLSVVDSLSPSQTGGFFDHMGKTISW